MPNEVRLVVTSQNKAKGPVTDARKDVDNLVKAVNKIPDKKVLSITVREDAVEAAIDKIDKKKIDAKEAKITAKDDATPEIDKISKTKPKAIEVPVKADTSKLDVGGKFDEAGKAGASAFAGGFTGGLIGGGIVDTAASIITDAFARAGEKQRIAADLGNAMGITPEQAKQYGDRVGNMFYSGIGESKEQIAGAFGTLSSDVRNWSQLTVDQQDRVVKKAVGVASAFKIDVAEGVRAASSMVDNKLVGSFDEAFDLITTGYQTMGSRADDALDTLTEYSGYFEMLGIKGPQALGLIQQGLKGGARDTDFIADAFKEFGILAIENTDKTKDALKALGLNAKTTQEALRRGGDDAAAATDKIIDRLKAIKDPKLRDEVGLALFGTKWEDTMRQVVGSIDLGTAAVQGFKGATDNLTTGAISQTEELSRAWGKFTDDFGEDVATIINHQKDFMETQNTAIGSLFGFGDTVQASTDHLNGMGFGIDGVNNKVIGLAESLGGPGTTQFGNYILKLNDSELAVLGVKHELDTLAGRVYSMPDGTRITINTNTGEVIGNVDTLHRKVDNLPSGSKWFTYYIETVTTNKTYNMAPIPMGGGRAAGGPVSPFVGHAAEGGPRGGTTLVNEQGPELYRTQRGVYRDLQTGGTVIPAGQSAQMTAAANGGGMMGGGVIENHVHVHLDGKEIMYSVQKQVAKRGGDVQKVLGR